MRILTNSEARAYRRCPKEHHYAYVLGYRPVREAEALRFGSLVHLGLEAWWKATGDRLDAALTAMTSDDPFELARAHVSLQGYDALWSEEPYDTLAVEAEFTAPLVNPASGRPSRTFTLGGKLDVLVRDRRDGDTKLIEHKTSSVDLGPGSPYWRRLALDGQVSIYYTGASALGHPITECIYDVLGKPQLRPSKVPLTDPSGNKIVLDAAGNRVSTKNGTFRQTGDAEKGYVLQTRLETVDEYRDRLVAHVAENPARYYQRGAVVRLEQERVDAAYDVWSTARLIQEAAVLGRWPRNVDACERYGRFCPYWAACSGEASIDDPTQYRRVTNVHEELSTDAA